MSCSKICVCNGNISQGCVLHLHCSPFSVSCPGQAGESEKQKSYTAVCQLPIAINSDMVTKLNSTTDLVLHQQTPVRVSHRRADLVRHRTVYNMQCELIEGNQNHFILHLRTQVRCVEVTHKCASTIRCTAKPDYDPAEIVYFDCCMNEPSTTDVC